MVEHIEYSDPQLLVSFMYQKFVERLAERKIDAFTGSGKDVVEFIANGIKESIAHFEIPTSFSFQTKDHLLPHPKQVIISRLRDTHMAVLQLADQMADDASARQVHELHEWSLPEAKVKLCPLWPFLRQPCDKYRD